MEKYILEQALADIWQELPDALQRAMVEAVKSDLHAVRTGATAKVLDGLSPDVTGSVINHWIPTAWKKHKVHVFHHYNNRIKTSNEMSSYILRNVLRDVGHDGTKRGPYRPEEAKITTREAVEFSLALSSSKLYSALYRAATSNEESYSLNGTLARELRDLPALWGMVTTWECVGGDTWECTLTTDHESLILDAMKSGKPELRFISCCFA